MPFCLLAFRSLQIVVITVCKASHDRLRFSEQWNTVKCLQLPQRRLHMQGDLWKSLVRSLKPKGSLAVLAEASSSVLAEAIQGASDFAGDTPEDAISKSGRSDFKYLLSSCFVYITGKMLDGQ
eukprot:730313-Amphidinium_carterae.1